MALNFKLKKPCKIYKVFKKRNFTLTILLTNSYNMKKLNKKFRNKNKSTDVLSFPFFTSREFKLNNNKKLYLGDIAISYQIINKRSKKSNFLLEFDKVWIHGLLHLMGYNHIKNKDYYKMIIKEKVILDSVA